MAAATAPAPAVATSRAGNSTYAAVLALGGSSLMGFAGLAAAYFAVRHANAPDFVDKKMSFNNYAAVMATFSMVLASFSAGWGAVSARVGQRRWAATGFGLAAVAGIAALNLVWTIGKGVGLPVTSSPYTGLLYALLIAAAIAIAVGIVVSVAGLATCFGGHASPTSPIPAISAAWGQHIAGLAWLIVFIVIFLKK
jgi:heme/copper-type cytochrome/quinol oxidase subunit 3